MEQKREPEQKGFGGLGGSTFSDGLEAHYEIPLEADHNTKSLHTRKCADALDEPASTWDSRKRPKFSPAFTAPCKVLHASGEESLANMLIPVPMMYAYCVKNYEMQMQRHLLSLYRTQKRNAHTFSKMFKLFPFQYSLVRPGGETRNPESRCFQLHPTPKT